MFVEFEKCRMDRAVARDPNRPTLNFVYMDLDNGFMFAADGFLAVVKRIKVLPGSDEESDPKGVIAIHHEAMAYLMGLRHRDVFLLLSTAGDRVLVSNVNREIATTPMEKPHEEMVARLQKLVRATTPETNEPQVLIDLRKLQQIHQATGMDNAYITIDEEERHAPYFVSQTDAMAIVMPLHGDKLPTTCEESQILAEDFARGRQDEDESPDATEQTR